MTNQIPEKDLGKYFWDKNILRESFKGLLPESIISKKKTPFFYGKDEDKTYEYFYDILCFNNYQIIQEAFEDTELQKYFDSIEIKKYLKNLDRKGNTDLSYILKIINIGLLNRKFSFSFKGV